MKSDVSKRYNIHNWWCSGVTINPARFALRSPRNHLI